MVPFMTPINHHVPPSPSQTTGLGATNLSQSISSANPGSATTPLPTRGRGRGRGGRKRGGANASGQKRAPVQSWRNLKNQDGKSSLDLIVEWLTVEGNFNRWRSSETSKRDVAEEIAGFLKDNGFPNQDWKGVKQQITGLEKKFREALQWQEQTGQGIMDEAETRQTAEEDMGLYEVEDNIGAARSETEGVYICQP